jgi:hypothetical protein
MSVFLGAKYQYIASYYILKILGGAEFWKQKISLITKNKNE